MVIKMNRSLLILTKSREGRAKLNIIVSLGRQLVTLLCGIVVPRLLIGAFGSEAYGATTSITQFLAYITLLEGGIGGVARAALYKPLANNNIQVISEIVSEIKRFFRIIAYIFIVYVLILACSFQELSHVKCFDWLSTFLLVIVISISTFAQYFIGISYSVLLQAAQKSYITDLINIFATVMNTIVIVFLVAFGSNLIIVKFISSCVFVLRPILMWLFVKKDFKLIKCKKGEKEYLTQKWDGLAQHIAYFLYSNTDIAVLTIFSNLTAVAVYSVYYMVVSHIQNFATSFSTGMEALFGEMFVKREKDKLNKTFDYYDMLISFITVILFSVTLVLIVPFIIIYTSGIKDANYVQPIFAVLLTLSSIVTCLRTPYHNMTIAAGHFRQTQIAAYGEAVINIVLSIVLVIKLGLIGVAIGTLLAALFRMFYYAFYLTKHIFNRPIIKFIKREIVNVIAILLIVMAGNIIVNNWLLSGYLRWFQCGSIVTVIAVLITVLINLVFYKRDFILMLQKWRKVRY